MVMFRRIWHDPVASTVIAAVILAALSSTVGWIFYVRPKAEALVRPANAITANLDSIPAQLSIKTGKQYTVAEHKAFVDAETGFSFRVDEIDDGTFLWGLVPRADGALSQYTLPSGVTEELFRYPVGHRVPFDFGGRKFVFVIVDVEYKTRRAVVRVDELVAKAAK
jgi:hypothetical protein